MTKRAISLKQTVIICKWCGNNIAVTYKTRQPQFCSEACKQKYKRHEQKQRENIQVVAEEITCVVIHNWIEEGLEPVVYDLIDIAKRNSIEAAFQAAKVAKKVIRRHAITRDSTADSAPELDKLIEEARQYIFSGGEISSDQE